MNFTTTLPSAPALSRLKTETDVLIVGGGPVGMALAIELGLRNIDCQIVERVPAITDWWTRAMNTNFRTMEQMRRWGIAERLKGVNTLPAEWPSNRVSFSTGFGGREVACVAAPAFGSRRQLPHAAEDGLWIAQGQVQRVLLEKMETLSSVGCAFEQNCVGLTVDADGVEARIVSSDKKVETTVRAKYIVGCDASRSLVREHSGIQVSGAGPVNQQVAIFFRAPSLLPAMRERGFHDAAIYMIGGRDQLAGGARPMDEERWDYYFNTEAIDTDVRSIDREAIIAELVGPDVPFELESGHNLFYYDQIATEFHKDRVFIAGDAAHMIPPNGGHNLNLGIGDVTNLGWKLAAVLQGWGAPALLDSYDPERREILFRTRDEALDNLKRLLRGFSMLKESASVIEGGGAAADEIAAKVAEALAEDSAPQWESDGTVLDMRYTSSSIVARDDREAPAYDRHRYRPHAAPGHRAPMTWLTPDKALYDLFGLDFTLLCLSASAEAITMRDALAAALAKRGVPTTSLDLPIDGLRQLYDADLVLIRPDFQIAWRSGCQPSTPDRIVDLACGYLQKEEVSER